MKYISVIIVFLFLFIPAFNFAHEVVDPDDMHHDKDNADEDNVAEVSPVVLLIGLIGAAGIGGVVWYFMKKGKVLKSPQIEKSTTSDKNTR